MAWAVVMLAGLTAQVGRAEAAASGAPPIPIRFTLPEPGFVTLVIETPKGLRVRNLISETPFEAGEHVIAWDGLDDTGRDPEAARHAIYHIPFKRVEPGQYVVRGLFRPKLDILYQLTPYNEGRPPWRTASTSSEWLANHTSPQAVLFVPDGQAPKREIASPGGQILVGSFVSEGGSGLAWLNLQGRKLHGQMWIGGIWTGASHLARDVGDKPLPGVYAYAGAWWHGDKYNGNREELRLYQLVTEQGRGQAPRDKRLGYGEDIPVLKPNYKMPGDVPGIVRSRPALGGMAVRNGVLVVSLPQLDRLLFIDAAGHAVFGHAALPFPKGLAFEKAGTLLAVSGGTIVRLTLPALVPPAPAPVPPAGGAAAGAAAEGAEPPEAEIPMAKPETLVAQGLADPQQIALDPDGNIYVTDQGDSNQVKVYSPRGEPLRTIGKAGPLAVGPYDPLHMNTPEGITVTDEGHVWVAEKQERPKRVSVWTLDGKLTEAFYGPPQYGGGGYLDPVDKTRFYYAGMELRLHWDTGRSEPTAIYYRPEVNPFAVFRSGPPETPIHIGDRTYLTNCYNSSPTNGAQNAMIWLLKDGVAVRMAAIGRTSDWSIFRSVAPFSARWTGRIVPKYSEEYTFVCRSDGGSRVLIGSSLVVNNWEGRSDRQKGTITLEAGKPYRIVVEFRHNKESASARLLWSSQSQREETVPAAALMPEMEGDKTGGLSAEYFAGNDLRDSRLKRVDPTINFRWPDEGPFPMEPNPFRAGFKKDEKGKVQEPNLFAWSDLNGDLQMSADEVTFTDTDRFACVCVRQDLSIITSTGLLIRPSGYTDKGVPIYDASKAERLLEGAQGPKSSGGNQAVYSDDGWLVLTVAPKPFSPFGVGGAYRGEPRWSYPDMWPGLHASHNAPVPDFPGELIGTTRLLGLPIEPAGPDVGPLWCINGNKGTAYLMTMDGLFVATLFKDSRIASWSFPEAVKGMSVADASMSEENFWPSITQTVDGHVYMVARYGSLCEITGLDKIRRLPSQTFEVTAAQLMAAAASQRDLAAEKLAQAGRPELTVRIERTAPAVDGELDDWKDAQWVTLDERVKQVGDWGHVKVANQAALAVAGDRLYVAFKVDDPKLLENSGESPIHLFKTGGAVDLMIGADPQAKPDRRDAVPGDCRLLVTLVKGKTLAMLYRPVVEPKPDTEPLTFSSPLRTIRIDRVDDVSSQVQIAQRTVKDEKRKIETGVIELSVPLSVVGLAVKPGMTILGDVGILRGNGFETIHRVYWSNKAAALTSDVPSEAELTPRLWGTWTFKEESKR